MITKILIENFRSIKNLELNTNGLCSLIGPNSAGKTNILKALDILLGEIYPTERAFCKDDFFKRDENQQICIQVWFEDPLEVVKLTKCSGGGKDHCEPISFRLTHTKNESISFGATKFSVFDKFGNEFWGSGEARDQLSFVYIPSDRNLERQMTISKWTLFGKILRKVDECFRKKEKGENYSRLEEKFREAMKEPKKILESDIEGELSYKKFKDEFLQVCEDNTRGLTSNFGLNLEIYDPLFYYKTIQIIGKEELGVFNIEELGSGVQNLVLLSLFRTYAKLMKNKVVLAIEEPEIYLHPQAQRKLYSSFIGLAYPKNKEPGTQIFYTTHNPNFVNALRADESTILFKNENIGTYKLERSPNVTAEYLEKGKFKIYTHFNTERNELFFAKKVILVEGDSDKILFTTLCKEKWDIDIDKECVSIIECGGKGGVIYFIGVCRLLGIINFFAVWDEDSEKNCDDKFGSLKCAKSMEKGLEIQGNLEKFLKDKFPDKIFRNKHKVEDAYKWALNVDENEIPEEFNKMKNFLLSKEKKNNKT